jgi:hypothetical protein
MHGISILYLWSYLPQFAHPHSFSPLIPDWIYYNSNNVRSWQERIILT